MGYSFDTSDKETDRQQPTPLMSSFELLLIVEVPEHKKVLCQHEGCGRPVYKKVHVVLNEGKISVLGSECAKKLFAQELKTAKPKIDFGVRHELSETDVELLKNNTEQLVNKLQIEYESSVRKPEVVDYRSMNDLQLKNYCLEQYLRQKSRRFGMNSTEFGGLEDFIIS